MITPPYSLSSFATLSTLVRAALRDESAKPASPHLFALLQGLHVPRPMFPLFRAMAVGVVVGVVVGVAVVGLTVDRRDIGHLHPRS